MHTSSWRFLRKTFFLEQRVHDTNNGSRVIIRHAQKTFSHVCKGYKIIPLGTAEFHLLIILIKCYLEISKLWECVHNDTKYDIETNGGDKDEEWYVIDYNQSEFVKWSLRLVCIDVL